MFRFRLPGYGLGTLISFLSMLLKADTEVEVLACQDNINIFKDLERIFNLNLKKFKFSSIDTVHNVISNNVISDWGKLYAPYLTNDFIKFRELTIPLTSVRSKKKPMIGLSCYRDFNDIYYSKDAEILKSFPYNKIYPIEDYAKIWTKIKTLNYDVINLDQHITLEDKCFLMKEYCDAVIGYEGGMMHLAHCLNIPCMILPLRYDTMGEDIIGSLRVIDRLHLDKRTYLLKSIDEFLSLTFDQFQDLIEQLVGEQSYNNFYLNNHIKVLSVNVWQLSDNSTIKPELFNIEQAFISKFYTSLDIGGYSYV